MFVCCCPSRGGKLRLSIGILQEGLRRFWMIESSAHASSSTVPQGCFSGLGSLTLHPCWQSTTPGGFLGLLQMHRPGGRPRIAFDYVLRLPTFLPSRSPCAAISRVRPAGRDECSARTRSTIVPRLAWLKTRRAGFVHPRLRASHSREGGA